MEHTSRILAGALVPWLECLRVLTDEESSSSIQT